MKQVKHMYSGDGVGDHRGEDRCLPPCGLPRRHPVHQLPERGEEQQREEARRVGER